jgi:hypothetical protein
MATTARRLATEEDLLDTLEGEDVLPGFACALGSILD